MIDKSINNINCVDVREKLKEPTNEAIHLYSDRSQVLDDFTWKNGTPILSTNSNATIKFDITELEELVIYKKLTIFLSLDWLQIVIYCQFYRFAERKWTVKSWIQN